MFTCTLGYNLKVFCSTDWITSICFVYPTAFCLNCCKKCFGFLSQSMLFFSGFLSSNNYRSAGLHLWSHDPPNLKHYLFRCTPVRPWVAIITVFSLSLIKLKEFKYDQYDQFS